MSHSETEKLQPVSQIGTETEHAVVSNVHHSCTVAADRACSRPEPALLDGGVRIELRRVVHRDVRHRDGGLGTLLAGIGLTHWRALGRPRGWAWPERSSAKPLARLGG